MRQKKFGNNSLKPIKCASDLHHHSLQNQAALKDKVELIIWQQQCTLTFDRSISSCGWAVHSKKNNNFNKTYAINLKTLPHTCVKELGKQLSLAERSEGHPLNLRLSCTKAVKADVLHTSSYAPKCDIMPFCFDIFPPTCLSSHALGGFVDLGD